MLQYFHLTPYSMTVHYPSFSSAATQLLVANITNEATAKHGQYQLGRAMKSGVR